MSHFSVTPTADVPCVTSQRNDHVRAAIGTNP